MVVHDSDAIMSATHLVEENDNHFGAARFDSNRGEGVPFVAVNAFCRACSSGNPADVWTQLVSYANL